MFAIKSMINIPKVFIKRLIKLKIYIFILAKPESKATPNSSGRGEAIIIPARTKVI